MEQAQKKPQSWILVFVLCLANVLGILYVAALPDLTQSLQITKAQAQDTISLYLVGCVAAQFIYPSLSKAIGRKGALYVGCGLAILGSGLCLLSIEIQYFSLLLIGRFLTAFGAGCGAILTSTMVSESYTVSESKKIFSHLIGGFVVIPSIAVTLGGYITQYLSWEKCFYFMFFYSLFVTVLGIFLPETGKEKSLGHLHIVRIAKSYFKELSNVRALLYGLITANAAIILYVFASEAPFIANSRLHISADHFGLFNLIPNFGFFLGGIFSARLSHIFKSNQIVIFASIAFFAFAALMWLLFEINLLNTLILFGLPFFIFAASAFILPNGQVCALATTDDKPYMSSILYIIQYSWVALSVAFLRFFPPADANSLPIIYTVSGVLMIVLWIIVQKFACKTK